MPTRATAQTRSGTTVAAEVPETNLAGHAVPQDAQMGQAQGHEESLATDDVDELDLDYYDPMDAEMSSILEGTVADRSLAEDSSLGGVPQWENPMGSANGGEDLVA